MVNPLHQNIHLYDQKSNNGTHLPHRTKKRNRTLHSYAEEKCSSTPAAPAPPAPPRTTTSTITSMHSSSLRTTNAPSHRFLLTITFLVTLFGSLLVFLQNVHSHTIQIDSLPQDTNILRRTQSDCNDASSQEEGGWVNSIPKPLQYTLIGVLILFSAFFSGLTLSMMGLDTTGLEIVMSGDDPILSRAAAKIYPIRKNGNLLLCTLLLGNVAVNTLLGILMADITGGTVGFITSTALIVIFGEIIPQVRKFKIFVVVAFFLPM